MTTWEPISRNEEITTGTRYRVRFPFLGNLPINRVAMIADALHAWNGLRGNYRFDKVATELVPSKVSGRASTYQLTIEFHRVGSGTPVFIIMGLIIAALVSIGIIVWGTAYVVEKVSEAGLSPEERIRLEQAKGKGIDPSIIAAGGALVAAAYFMKGR